MLHLGGGAAEPTQASGPLAVARRAPSVIDACRAISGARFAPAGVAGQVGGRREAREISRTHGEEEEKPYGLGWKREKEREREREREGGREKEGESQSEQESQ